MKVPFFCTFSYQLAKQAVEFPSDSLAFLFTKLWRSDVALQRREHVDTVGMKVMFWANCHYKMYIMQDDERHVRWGIHFGHETNIWCWVFKYQILIQCVSLCIFLHKINIYFSKSLNTNSLKHVHLAFCLTGLLNYETLTVPNHCLFTLWSLDQIPCILWVTLVQANIKKYDQILLMKTLL